MLIRIHPILFIWGVKYFKIKSKCNYGAPEESLAIRVRIYLLHTMGNLFEYGKPVFAIFSFNVWIKSSSTFLSKIKCLKSYREIFAKNEFGVKISFNFLQNNFELYKNIY